MILPGSTVVVTDQNSIYRGYVGCVQRIDGKRAAILMDSHTPWDKMITFRLSELREQTEGFQYYPPKKGKWKYQIGNIIQEKKEKDIWNHGLYVLQKKDVDNY